jgi:hypothetical protein
MCVRSICSRHSSISSLIWTAFFVNHWMKPGLQELNYKLFECEIKWRKWVWNVGKEGRDADNSNTLEMYTRDTQSHWRPIVVRLGPRTRVQRTRSGQRALNSIQLYCYYPCIGYVYCGSDWNLCDVFTGGMILRLGP